MKTKEKQTGFSQKIGGFVSSMKANAMPETTNEERKAKSAALRAAKKELDLFHKKAYDYIKARALVKQETYYQSWDEIFER